MRTWNQHIKHPLPGGGIFEGNMEEFIKQFVKERNEALLSLDKDKIEAHIRKYKGQIPEDDRRFWGGVHMARIGITAMDEESKNLSRQWLKDNGFNNAPWDDEE